MNKYNIDPSQEIFAVGMACVVGSFFGGFTAVASFSRSAVNAMSGAKTPFSSMYNT